MNDLSLIQTPNKGFGSFIVIGNDLIGRFINHHGFWEVHLLHIYTNFLKETDVVLDAGANLGFHTVNMAKKCKHVYAFEPQPLMYNLLSTNILFGNCTHKVTQFKLGLGDKEELVKMQALKDFDEKDGTHNFGGRGISKNDEGEELINVVAFDSLGLDVTVIKMDIQGYELHALRGMLETVKRSLPWIMLENYMGEGHEDDEEVLKILFDLGYEIYRFKAISEEDCICVNKNNPNHADIKAALEGTLKDHYRKI